MISCVRVPLTNILTLLEDSSSLRYLEFIGDILSGGQAPPKSRVVHLRHLRSLELNISTDAQVLLLSHLKLPQTCQFTSFMMVQRQSNETRNWRAMLHPLILSHVQVNSLVHVRIHTRRVDFWVRDAADVRLSLRTQWGRFFNEAGALLDYLQDLAVSDGATNTVQQDASATNSTSNGLETAWLPVHAAVTVHECMCSLCSHRNYVHSECGVTAAADGCQLCRADSQ